MTLEHKAFFFWLFLCTFYRTLAVCHCDKLPEMVLCKKCNALRGFLAAGREK